MNFLRHALFVLALALPALSMAKIPDSYSPIVIEPSSFQSKRLIDLRPALAKARETGKPIFVYVGAYDCPPCQVFTRMLERNTEEMKPLMEKWTVVDIRAWIRGPKFEWQLDDRKIDTPEFFRLLDYKRRSGFPAYLLFDQEFKLMRLAPEGVDISDDPSAFRALIER